MPIHSNSLIRAMWLSSIGAGPAMRIVQIPRCVFRIIHYQPWIAVFVLLTLSTRYVCCLRHGGFGCKTHLLSRWSTFGSDEKKLTMLSALSWKEKSICLFALLLSVNYARPEWSLSNGIWISLSALLRSEDASGQKVCHWAASSRRRRRWRWLDRWCDANHTNWSPPLPLADDDRWWIFVWIGPNHCDWLP